MSISSDRMFYASMVPPFQPQPVTPEPLPTELAGGACVEQGLPQGLRVPRALSSGAGQAPSNDPEPRQQTGFALRSLPTLSAATPERSSSSSLPPSFAPGRCATIFFDGGAADRGTPALSPAAVSRTALVREG